LKKKFTEIIVYGRGGQGAWTASVLLARAALKTGKYAQSFPEFGPERSGAPVRAYVRISNEPITLRASITHADYVIVIDQTLLNKAIAVSREDGTIVTTFKESTEELKKILDGFKGTVWYVNAFQIALDIIGRPITNTAMLGAFVKATEEKFVTLDALIEATKEVLSVKLPEDIVNKNIEAIKKAYDEVKKL